MQHERAHDAERLAHRLCFRHRLQYIYVSASPSAVCIRVTMYAVHIYMCQHVEYMDTCQHAA